MFYPYHIWILLGTLAVSLATTVWLVRSAHRHGHMTADHDLDGPQKFHALPVPRVGGVGIAAGVVVGCVVAWFNARKQDPVLWQLVLCSVPAFAGGLLEDLTKRVGAHWRLLATMLAAAAAAGLTGAVIPVERLDGLAWLLTWPMLAWMATLLAVGGVANAVNIIDGFNGLASMCAALMFAAIALVAYQVGDIKISLLALICLASVMGFFILNFPAGLIFLGDGGSYFIGFMVAELSLLLTARNPSVSPYFALMICAYPVLETLFSIYRRKVVRGVPAMSPDGIHLHTLVYRRLIRRVAPGLTARQLVTLNSRTAPYLWALCMLSLVPAISFWDDSVSLVICLLLFTLIYVYLYSRIVRFRTPKWLGRFLPARGAKT